MTRRLIIAPLLLTLALAACRRESVERRHEPTAVPVRVVTLPFLSYAPIMIALDEGYFADEGLNVEILNARTADGTLLLANGEADVYGGHFGAGLFNAIARGADLEIVACKGFLETEGCAYDAILARTELVESGQLDSPGGLRNRRISYTEGSLWEQITEKILASQGLTTKDVSHIDLPVHTALDGFESGAVDVRQVSEPHLSEILASGAARVWHRTDEFAGSAQWGVIVFGKRLLRDEPETGRRFLKGYLRGIRKYQEGKTESNVEIIARYTKLDEDVIRRSCWPAVHADGTINVESVLAYVEWAKSRGYLDRSLSEEEFWDPTLIEEAARSIRQHPGSRAGVPE